MTINRTTDNKCSKIVFWMNENEGWITMFSEGQSLKNLRDNTKKYNTCDFREQSKSTVQKKKKWSNSAWKRNKCGERQTVKPYNRILFSNKRNNYCWIVWMNLNMDESQRHMLSERSQSPNGTNYLIPFLWQSAKGKSTGTEQIKGCQGLGKRKVWVQQTAQNIRGEGTVLYSDCWGSYRNLHALKFT